MNNAKVCVIVPPDCKGGVEYFITENGKIDAPVIFDANELNPEGLKDIADLYKKIYLINIHIPLAEEYESMIQQEFNEAVNMPELSLKIYEK